MTDAWTQDPQVRDDPDLRAFLDELATTGTEPIDPAVRTQLLEDVLAEAASRRPVPVASPWRRRVRGVLALTGAKLVLAASVAVAATTGGMAATGTLPAPVQQFAHEVGQQLGIGIPAAPGQAKKVDGDDDSTGRDHAPGQLSKTDDDPDSTGRDHAPGQVRREQVVPGNPPGHTGDGPAQDRPGRDDRPAPPADPQDDDVAPPVAPQQDDPPAAPQQDAPPVEPQPQAPPVEPPPADPPAQVGPDSQADDTDVTAPGRGSQPPEAPR